MAYLDNEISVREGKPVELYDFAVGVLHWRYTSAAEEVEYLGHTYLAEPVKRGNLEITDNAFKNDLEITVARDNPFAVQFIPGPLEKIATFTLYRGHEGDYVTYWSGVVAAVNFNSNEVIITCSPNTTGMLRIGLVRRYQRLCDYALYSGGRCKVFDTVYKSIGIITTISGTIITSAAFALRPDGYYIGGKIVVGSAQRLIMSHAGTTITISRVMLNVIIGNSFSVYAGCDHQMNTCRTKFNNLNNYGGQPWIPNKNPFSGDPIDIGIQDRPASGLIV